MVSSLILNPSFDGFKIVPDANQMIGKIKNDNLNNTDFQINKKDLKTGKLIELISNPCIA